LKLDSAPVEASALASLLGLTFDKSISISYRHHTPTTPFIHIPPSVDLVLARIFLPATRIVHDKRHICPGCPTLRTASNMPTPWTPTTRVRRFRRRRAGAQRVSCCCSPIKADKRYKSRWLEGANEHGSEHGFADCAMNRHGVSTTAIEGLAVGGNLHPDDCDGVRLLTASRPILTPKTVLPLFFGIGIIFAPIGGGLLYASSVVRDLSLSCDAASRLC
jgi:hypothetical protein